MEKCLRNGKKRFIMHLGYDDGVVSVFLNVLIESVK